MTDAPTSKTNPAHYNELRPEPITVIEGWSLGYHLGNATKYIARAGRKVGESVLDDLKKARWYLDREIARLEQQQMRAEYEQPRERAEVTR